MGNWGSYFPLIEFTYNNSFHSTIRMTPYLDLYGRMYRTSLCWYESGESVVLGLEFNQQTTEKIRMIHEKIKASQSRPNSYNDKRKKELGL